MNKLLLRFACFVVTSLTLSAFGDDAFPLKDGDVVLFTGGTNMVRLVRGGAVEKVTSGPKVEQREPQRGGSKRGGGFMKNEDRNGDGKVCQSEFRGPAGHFSHLDKNGDGFITADEAPAGPPNR